MPVKIIIAIICMILAGIAGLWVRNRLQPAIRPIIALCFLAACITVASRHWQPNGWLHNIYIPFDFGIVMYAATSFLTGRIRSLYMPLMALAYAAVWIILILVNGIQPFCNWAYLTGCIFITITYLYASFQIAMSDNMPDRKSAFFFCFAILLYYAPAVPLFAMLNYLIGHDPALATTLYGNINWTLSNARYLLIAIYFLTYMGKWQHDK